MHKTIAFPLLVVLLLNVAACGEMASLPVEAGMGMHPTLPAT